MRKISEYYETESLTSEQVAEQLRIRFDHYSQNIPQSLVNLIIRTHSETCGCITNQEFALEIAFIIRALEHKFNKKYTINEDHNIYLSENLENVLQMNFARNRHHYNWIEGVVRRCVNQWCKEQSCPQNG